MNEMSDSAYKSLAVSQFTAWPKHRYCSVDSSCGLQSQPNFLLKVEPVVCTETAQLFPLTGESTVVTASHSCCQETAHSSRFSMVASGISDKGIVRCTSAILSADGVVLSHQTS